MRNHDDVNTVRARFAERLAELGIAGQSAKSAETKLLPTIFPGLAVGLGSIQVTKQPLARDPEHYFASVEAIFSVSHPVWGKHEIADMVTSPAQPSREAALGFCVDTLFNVTFPPIHALFDPNAPKVRRGEVPVDDKASGRAVKWNVLAGGLSVVGESGEQLMAYLVAHSPVSHIFDLVAPALTRKTLHWIKLYGENAPLGPKFGCVMDGRSLPDAQQQMKQRFQFQAPEVRSPWEFRDFLIWLPEGGGSGPVEALPVDLTGGPSGFPWPFARRNNQKA